jgi:hypothetical protein
VIAKPTGDSGWRVEPHSPAATLKKMEKWDILPENKK